MHSHQQTALRAAAHPLVLIPGFIDALPLQMGLGAMASPLAPQLPRTVGAVPWLGALLLRVQPAGLGPLVIHRAQPRLGVQKVAVPTRPARHREDRVLVVEVVDQLRFLQPLGNVADFFMLRLERVHQLQPHQVRELHLQRHRAAVGRAGVAQACAVAGPGVQAVYVNDGDGGAHGEGLCLRAI